MIKQAKAKSLRENDDLNNRLDEMADLCEHWKRWRKERDHTPHGVRAALVILAREVATIAIREQIGATNDD